ncbi:MAG TPA: ABC transporter substrate-binding protein [Chloroflexota bacterium]|nr:ABC transporter substrate-binding protein [Chloroflexota bacterium]
MTRGLRWLIGTALLATLACTPPSRPGTESGAPPAPPGAPTPTVPVASPAATAPARVALRVGHTAAVPWAGIYLALARGYFAEEGLDIELELFASGEQQIPALATDQISASGLGLSAGLFSAAARGVALKVVAGVSSNEPGFSSSALVVRKDLLDSGAVRTLADLRGRTVATIAQSASNSIALSRGLQAAGVADSEVDLVAMPSPDMVAALANSAIDAALPTEPFVARAVQLGVGVRWKGMDELYPGQLLTTIGYSPAFVREQPDAARRFLVAYLRGARDYADAFRYGHGRQAVSEVLAEYTTIKDVALYDLMTPSGISPDGDINRDSMQFDQEWYIAHGYLRERAALDQLVDQRFREAALQRLGPYRPPAARGN